MCYCNSCKSTYNSFTDHEFVAISKSWMRDNFSPIFLNLSLNAVYPYFMRLKTFWMLCYAWMKIPILMKEKLVICVQNKILKLKYAKVYLLSFICPLSFQVRSAALTALSSDFSGDFSSFQFYWVSQQVWDMLNVIFWCLEVCKRRIQILRKNVFCSIKLLFEPFLWAAKMKMEF